MRPIHSRIKSWYDSIAPMTSVAVASQKVSTFVSSHTVLGQSQ